MATSPWDDIPDPCHFEPCPPEPSCGPCSAPSPFSHTPTIPGVPRGRKIVPLVRVNGQIQDVNAGMHVPNAFIEPPHIHWDAANGILNVGGRFVKLTGVGNMVHSDCHGQAIGACTAIMTCPNFSEIIGASTGLDFKNSANPFAGLTVVLRANSLLVLDNGGVGVDAAAVCNSVETCLEAKDWGPVPTMEVICASVKSCLQNEGWGPIPSGPSGGETPAATSDPLPLYACHNSGNTKVFDTTSTIELNFFSGSGMIIPSTASGIVNYYSGTDSAATLIGNSTGTAYTVSDLSNITLVAVANSLCNDSGDPEPPPAPAPQSKSVSTTTYSCSNPYTGDYPASSGTLSISVSGVLTYTVTMHPSVYSEPIAITLVSSVGAIPSVTLTSRSGSPLTYTFTSGIGGYTMAQFNAFTSAYATMAVCDYPA